ncbi:MAG: hypothetical protein AAF550_05420 [Myxococcota bacterium]
MIARFFQSMCDRISEIRLCAVGALALLGVAHTLSGCAVTASRADYRDYRRIRLAESDEQRALAIGDYISDHPNGRWIDEVRALFIDVEYAAFRRLAASEAGLQRFLSQYPEGPSAERARERLSAMNQIDDQLEREEQARRRLERQQQAARFEERRLWARRTVTRWTSALLGIRGWGRPLPEVVRTNPEFGAVLEGVPMPRCNSNECIKYVSLDFVIPVPGRTRIERRSVVLVRLGLSRERQLVRAELLLPNRGFSRWYELEHRSLISDYDTDLRMESIVWAAQQILRVLREIMPEAAPVHIVPEPIDPLPRDIVQLEESGVADSGSLVIPLALEGFQAGDVRVVVFASAEDDRADAFDGLFIEYLAP